MTWPVGHQASVHELDDICRKIANIADLELQDWTIWIEHDNISLPQRRLETLRKSGHLPSRRQVEHQLNEGEIRDLDLPLQTLHNEKPRTLEELETDYSDLMGVYQSRKLSITIFNRMCYLVSARHDLDLEALQRVVTAHEAAHAVTHWGEDAPDYAWGGYSHSSSHNKELFAQIYALEYLRSTNDDEAVDAFLKLNRYQPEEYQSWTRYEGLARSSLNSNLMTARQTDPESNSRISETVVPVVGDKVILDPQGKKYRITQIDESYQEIIGMLDKAQQRIEGLKTGEACRDMIDGISSLVQRCHDGNESLFGPTGRTPNDWYYQDIVTEISRLREEIVAKCASHKEMEE